MNQRSRVSTGQIRVQPRRGRPQSRRFRIEAELLEMRQLLTSAGGPMAIGMNLNYVATFSEEPMFADVMKMTYDSWSVTPAASVGSPWSVGGVTEPSMDQNGYPIGLGNLPSQGYVLDTAAFFHQGGHYPTGTYTLTFDGKGTVEIYDFADAPQVFTQSGGLGSPNNVQVTATGFNGIAIVIASSDPTDYVRNIRLVMPGCQSTYQTQPFNPLFLSDLRQFSWLRFDNPMQINSPTQQVGMTWSEETPMSYRTQTTSTGISIEYIVDLCNELQEGMWVNMPVGASTDYYTNFAQYTANNLDSGLPVYVEYGNETWNPLYGKEYNYIANYATANGLSNPQANADLATACWNTWLGVFAGETSRVVRVAANQCISNPNLLNQEIARLVADASPSDPHHGFDVISGAPYLGFDTSSFNASTTVQQIEQTAMNALSTTFAATLNGFMSAANSWDTKLGLQIPVDMYEGGWYLVAKTSDPWYAAFAATQSDPGVYKVITAYLNDLANAGASGLTYYEFTEQVDVHGEFGTMDYLGEPADRIPKYNALIDYIDSPEAVLVSSDTTTQGSWIGTYGSDGYNVVANSSNYPWYAGISVAGASGWTWAGSTSDVRALQKASGSGRIAATWFGSKFSIDLNLIAGAHDVALYALDWDMPAEASKSRLPTPRRVLCWTPRR